MDKSRCFVAQRPEFDLYIPTKRLDMVVCCDSCPAGQRPVDSLWPASIAVKTSNSVKAHLKAVEWSVTEEDT